MVNVTPVDGIVYGFRLFGYLLAVFIVGIVITALGGAIAESGDGAGVLVGGLVAIAGTVTVLAGFLGIQYKIIADGVEQGMSTAGSSPSNRDS